MEFNIRYDEYVLNAAVWTFMKRRGFEAFGWLGLAAILLAIVAFIFLIWQGDHSWITGFIGAALLFIVMIFGVVWQQHRQVLRGKLAAIPSRQATVKLTESDISFISEAGTSTLPWSSFTEVWKLDTFWLLFVATNNYVTIPTDGVPSEALKYISERLPDGCKRG